MNAYERAWREAIDRKFALADEPLADSYTAYWDRATSALFASAAFYDALNACVMHDLIVEDERRDGRWEDDGGRL